MHFDYESEGHHAVFFRCPPVALLAGTWGLGFKYSAIANLWKRATLRAPVPLTTCPYYLIRAKFDSMTCRHAVHRNGQLVREGRGLAFFTSRWVAPSPPCLSNDLPFIFNETTADYQSISIQPYRPDTCSPAGRAAGFYGEQPAFIKERAGRNQRLVNEAQTGPPRPRPQPGPEGPGVLK
jgi:hypothetical protein